jgi:hypothetical protein
MSKDENTYLIWASRPVDNARVILPDGKAVTGKGRQTISRQDTLRFLSQKLETHKGVIKIGSKGENHTVRLLQALGTLLRKANTTVPKVIKISTSEGYVQIEPFTVKSDFKFIER